MSRLQPKNILNQRRLFSRILGYSAALHLVVLGVLLFNNPQQSFRFSLTATAIDTNIPIVFVSHPKPRGGGARGSGSAATTTAQTTSVSAAMPKRGTTLVQEKPAAKKNSKQTKKAKLEGKKKPEIKKKQTAKAVEQKKVEQSKKEVEKLVAASIGVHDATALEGAAQDPNVLYVTHEEFDALQKEEYLRNEVASSWQCPPGLNPDLSCVVKVSVDHEGNVADVAIDSSSGVLIFDTSAKMALGAFTPPPWSYGNSLLITFKQ